MDHRKSIRERPPHPQATCGHILPGFPKQRTAIVFSLHFERDFMICTLQTLESCCSMPVTLPRSTVCFPQSKISDRNSIVPLYREDAAEMEVTCKHFCFSLGLSKPSWPVQQMGMVPGMETLQEVFWGKCKAAAPEGAGSLLLSTIALAGYKMCCFQILLKGSYAKGERVKGKPPALHIQHRGTGHLVSSRAEVTRGCL